MKPGRAIVDTNVVVSRQAAADPGIATRPNSLAGFRLFDANRRARLSTRCLPVGGAGLELRGPPGSQGDDARNLAAAHMPLGRTTA